MTGWLRTPASVAMYRTRLTSARPPQMQRLPRQATAVAVKRRQASQGGNLLAIEFPSSGKRASKILDNTVPTPGADRSSSSGSRQMGVSRIMAANSSFFVSWSPGFGRSANQMSSIHAGGPLGGGRLAPRNRASLAGNYAGLAHEVQNDEAKGLDEMAPGKGRVVVRLLALPLTA